MTALRYILAALATAYAIGAWHSGYSADHVVTDAQCAAYYWLDNLQ